MRATGVHARCPVSHDDKHTTGLPVVANINTMAVINPLLGLYKFFWKLKYGIMALKKHLEFASLGNKVYT